MICWILGITEAQINTLRAAPSLAGDLAMVSHMEGLLGRFDEALKRMSPEQRNQFEAATRPVGDAAQSVAKARERLVALAPFEQALSIEKSWHILHYLFTGHVGPANAPGDLLLTGEDLGPDLGYGPPRLHGHTATRDFSQFLDTLDLVRLQARVNLTTMGDLGIYSMPMGRGSEAEYERELRNEVGLYFPRLRDYVRKMSEKGNGLLIWLA
jgi:hypothetical protein